MSMANGSENLAFEVPESSLRLFMENPVVLLLSEDGSAYFRTGELTPMLNPAGIAFYGWLVAPDSEAPDSETHGRLSGRLPRKGAFSAAIREITGRHDPMVKLRFDKTLMNPANVKSEPYTPEDDNLGRLYP